MCLHPISYILILSFFFFFFFFFFNDTATTEIYTLSLHDALPIQPVALIDGALVPLDAQPFQRADDLDRKSTRLNSSHVAISYAVFCLKKKKKKKKKKKQKEKKNIKNH